jgi:ATP-dependent Clp protease adapter protein ClpS
MPDILCSRLHVLPAGHGGVECMSRLFDQPETIVTIKVQRPPMWTCVFHQSNTPPALMIHILTEYFNQDQMTSLVIIDAIQQRGKTQVGVWQRDIAELKAYQGTRIAAQKSFTLNIIPEPLPPV